MELIVLALPIGDAALGRWTWLHPLVIGGGIAALSAFGGWLRRMNLERIS